MGVVGGAVLEVFWGSLVAGITRKNQRHFGGRSRRRASSPEEKKKGGLGGGRAGGNALCVPKTLSELMT